MTKNSKKMQRILGFTLVELMIVIGVISVLVTIVSFSYRGAQHSSAVATVKSNLSEAGSKIKAERYDGVSGQFSTTIPSTVDISDGVNMIVNVDIEANTFCIDGSHQKYDDIKFYYSSDQGLGEGLCSDLIAYTPPEVTEPTAAPDSAPIVNVSGITATAANYSWTSVDEASGYHIQWRVNGGAWSVSDLGEGMSLALSSQPAGAKLEAQVRGYNESGEGPWSSIKVAYLTMATAPTLSASGITTTGATYSWSTVSGATSYTMQWRLNGGSWNTLNKGTSTSQVMGPTTQGGKLEAQVRATNGGSTSPWSPISTAQLSIDGPAWNKWNQTESYPNWTSWATRTDGGSICASGLNLYSRFRDGVSPNWNSWGSFSNRGLNATSTAQYTSTIANYTSTLQAQIGGYCKNEASGAVSATATTNVYTAQHTPPTITLKGPVECAGAYSGRPVYQLRLWLDEVSYNFSANTSNVNWRLYRYSTSSSYHSYDQTKTWPWAVSINGSGWSGASNSIAFKVGGAGTVETIATGSLTVAHNADGTKVISYAGSDGPGSSIFGSASCSSTYTLSDLRP